MTIDVVLVDDHGVLRDGVRHLLELHNDIRVVAVAADGEGGVALAAKFRPNVVVMDVLMPKLGGIEAARRIARESPDTAVLILTVSSSPEIIREAIAAGVRGYMLKESATGELIAAIRAVAAGRRYACAGVAAKAIDWDAGAATGLSGLDALTSREHEILHLIVEGKSNAEAAQMLGLSPRTVETYRSRMMEKLQLDDLPSLVRFAIRHGIIGTD